MTGVGSPAARDLASLVAGLAAGLPDATSSPAGGRTTWSRAAVAFATLDGGALELRLDTGVAAAALRTPDTTASSRGTPWVRFAPTALDDHAVDRATAWFSLAYRRAAAS